VLGSDGNFYGTTKVGGDFSDGIVFRISPGGDYTNLYSFSGYPTDGATPNALVQGSDVISTGHASKRDELLRHHLSDQSRRRLHESLLIYWTSKWLPDDGQSPQAPLLQASDGTFYGTTLYGASPPATCSI